MFYKNKNIRSNYSVVLGTLIFGTIMIVLSLWALIYGFFESKAVLANVQQFDELLDSYEEHVRKAVYFDITEEPIYLGKAYKKSSYYLLSDGNVYHVAEISKKGYEKIKSEMEASGSCRIEGTTIYIADKDRKNMVASKVSDYVGKSMSAFSMDLKLGDVIIEYKKLTFWNVFRGSIALIGMIIGVIALPFFCGGVYECKTSRKVISLSNISAKDIDREACEEGAVWLDSLRIYLTENMVVGIRSNGGSDHEGQVALKYGEVQSIHAYNEVKYTSETEKTGKTERYMVEAVATDGQTYVLTANKYALYSYYLKEEKATLFERLLEKNPNVVIQQSADEDYEDEYDDLYDNGYDEDEE